MKLKTVIKSLEEVDEKYHDLYVQQGEEYVLESADESEVIKKLAEFRNNNKSLFTKIKDMEAKMKRFEGIDPDKWEEAQQALAEKAEKEEKELTDKGQFEALFQKRFEAAKAETDRILKAKDDAFRKAQEETSALKMKLGTHLIDAEVQKAVMKAGKLRDGAIDDVISRARKVWNLDDHGNITPKKNGEIIFGKTGDQLTIEEWAADLPSEAPHLFESSRGGGAEGGNPPGKKQSNYVDNDPASIAKHLEDIAKGKMQVRM